MTPYEQAQMKQRCIDQAASCLREKDRSVPTEAVLQSAERFWEFISK